MLHFFYTRGQKKTKPATGESFIKLSIGKTGLPAVILKRGNRNNKASSLRSSWVLLLFRICKQVYIPQLYRITCGDPQVGVSETNEAAPLRGTYGFFVPCSLWQASLPRFHKTKKPL
jgi:hypothetical protein